MQERFYSLRDHAPFKRLTQVEYDAMSPIFDSDLPGPRGWKLDLAAGEHVVTDAITVNGVTLFTTFKPANSTKELCEATGTNRVYAVKVENAKPALDLDDDGRITDADESRAVEGSTSPQRAADRDCSPRNVEHAARRSGRHRLTARCGGDTLPRRQRSAEAMRPDGDGGAHLLETHLRQLAEPSQGISDLLTSGKYPFLFPRNFQQDSGKSDLS